MKIQAIARGRAGRAAAGVEKVKREERMEVNKKRQMEKSIRMTSKDKANAQKALEKRQAIFKKTIQGIAYESKVVQTELREVVGTVRDALRARERKGAMLGGRSGLLLSKRCVADHGPHACAVAAHCRASRRRWREWRRHC